MLKNIAAQIWYCTSYADVSGPAAAYKIESWVDAVVNTANTLKNDEGPTTYMSDLEIGYDSFTFALPLDESLDDIDFDGVDTRDWIRDLRFGVCLDYGRQRSGMAAYAVDTKELADTIAAPNGDCASLRSYAKANGLEAPRVYVQLLSAL